MAVRGVRDCLLPCFSASQPFSASSSQPIFYSPSPMLLAATLPSSSIDATSSTTTLSNFGRDLASTLSMLQKHSESSPQGLFPLRAPLHAAPLAPRIVPPPPYHVHFANGDVDVVGLTDTARDVCLSDDDEVQKPSTSTAVSLQLPTRPSVIRNGYASAMRRSASSVSTRDRRDAVNEPDVSEHFRRSLSGKWPRRHHAAVAAAHYASTPTQNSVRKTNSNCSSSQLIINQSQIEDHFRRALSRQEYEAWCQGRSTNLSTSPS